MSWFRKELIECAACKGIGKQAPLRPVELEMEGPHKDFFMLLQGICLACRGAGKVRR